MGSGTSPPGSQLSLAAAGCRTQAGHLTPSEWGWLSAGSGLLRVNQLPRGTEQAPVSSLPLTSHHHRDPSEAGSSPPLHAQRGLGRLRLIGRLSDTVPRPATGADLRHSSLVLGQPYCSVLPQKMIVPSILSKNVLLWNLVSILKIFSVSEVSPPSTVLILHI